MTIQRRDLNRLLLLSGAAAMVPAVARAAPGTPVAGGTLNWAYYPDPNAIIAINTSSGTGQGPKINEGLLWFDYDLNPKRLLAAAWSISQDGLRYTFHLRPGVKWHDGPDGVRFKVRLARNPFLPSSLSDFSRQSLGTVGIGAQIINVELASYLKTVYIDRAWDLTIESLSNTFDPTLGMQRAYWSKNFKIGLVFSNASKYANPEVDALLEATAVEPDEAKRRALWYQFQAIIHRELPGIDLVAAGAQIVANKRVHNFAPGAEGINYSFGDIWLDPGA